ncbi:hypothetical protein FJTKL_09908 [Diaporthe vaccinii]|uniref:Uncharacterized protein n=1 Tax=Diaporthe vaccinii TaxID=105482 RepID=A0ABR4EMF5_9PEZI
MPAGTCWGYRNSERTENFGISGWARKPRPPSPLNGFSEQCALPRKISTSRCSRNWAAAIEKHVKRA